MILLQQTGFHIEDKLKGTNGKGRLISEVIDFYTDVEFYDFELIEKKFVDLKVTGRNINAEFGFIQHDDFVRINLGSLKKFPKAKLRSIISDKSLYHVKLQIDYIQQDPKFDIHKHFYTGYDTSYEIKGPIQVEFTITLPLGLEMENKNSILNRLKRFLSSRNEENEIRDKLVDNSLDMLLFQKDGEKKINDELISCHKPHVKIVNGKHVYHYIIDQESYELIENTPDPWIELQYTVKNNRYLFLFSYFSGILMIFASFFLAKTSLIDFSQITNQTINATNSLAITNSQITNTTFNLVMNVSLTFLIVSLSFTILLATFAFKEGYEIPYKNITLIFTASTFVLLFFTYFYMLQAV